MPGHGKRDGIKEKQMRERERGEKAPVARHAKNVVRALQGSRDARNRAWNRRWSEKQARLFEGAQYRGGPYRSHATCALALMVACLPFVVEAACGCDGGGAFGSACRGTQWVSEKPRAKAWCLELPLTWPRELRKRKGRLVQEGGLTKQPRASNNPQKNKSY